ncbi:MAG: 16S rRNA (guanine(527)-N(7))-methyltransferase RsmG [Pyrinomonadaceae bacterium]
MSGSYVEEFALELISRAADYEVRLNANDAAALSAYYERVLAWNPRLHLVAPCSPAEFATRHILESLTLLKHLPHGARVTDVGSGAGLPIIPCLIVRPDINATLIEASPKKAVFLREALRLVNRQSATSVVAERFEKLPSPAAEFVTCRALDRFAAMLPKLIAWAEHAEALLFFGGAAIEAELRKSGLAFTSTRLPNSEQRFLFVASKNTPART